MKTLMDDTRFVEILLDYIDTIWADHYREYNSIIEAKRDELNCCLLEHKANVEAERKVKEAERLRNIELADRYFNERIL